MVKAVSPETTVFLSDVADTLESAASNMESNTGESGAGCQPRKSGNSNAGFASKMAYTTCYTLSYGLCFPIFLACHYIPKNNSFVEGLVEGGASANQSVDEMMEISKANRLARQQSRDKSTDFSEIIAEGTDALAPA
jgi:hypothetical protein